MRHTTYGDGREELHLDKHDCDILYHNLMGVWLERDYHFADATVVVAAIGRMARGMDDLADCEKKVKPNALPKTS